MGKKQEQRKAKLSMLDPYFIGPNPPSGDEPDTVVGSNSGPTITLPDYKFTSTIHKTVTDIHSVWDSCKLLIRLLSQQPAS